MGYKRTIVGLDIGSYAVRAAWAESRGRNFVISRVESLRLPSDRVNVDSIIGQWIEKLKINSFPCVLSIAGSQTIFQPLFISPEDPRTSDQAAGMEVLRFGEMSSEAMVFSHAPITVSPGERRLLLAMARETTVKTALEKAGKWNLNVINVVPTPAALFEAAIYSESHPSSSEATVFANIGQTGTEIAIGSKAGGLLFARAFGAGGQMFTDALAKTEGVTTAAAENRKLSEGMEEGAGSPLSSAMAQTADMWIQEMQACFAVYRSFYVDRRLQPSRLILAGGAAQMKGFAEYVQATLGLPASVFQSSAGAFQAPPAFATAVGLALAGLRSESGDVVLSLLPEETRVELVFRRQKPFWIAAGIAAFFILGVSLAAGFLDFKRMERHLAQQDEKLRRRQAIVGEIDAIRAKNNLIRTMASPIRHGIDKGAMICEILTLARANASQQESFFLLADADTYFNQPLSDASKPVFGMRDRRRAVQKPSEPQSSVSTSAFSRVILEGYTKNTSLASVKELIIKLSAADFIQSADLLPDDRMSPPAVPIAEHLLSQRFAIDIRLKTP